VEGRIKKRDEEVAIGVLCVMYRSGSRERRENGKKEDRGMALEELQLENAS